MKLFSPQSFGLYLCCTWSITGLLHYTGNAPWNEISDEKYAELQAISKENPATGLIEQSMDDNIISNMEYRLITGFSEGYEEEKRKHDDQGRS